MKSSQIMEGRFDEYIINNIYTTIKMIILCIFYLVVLIAAYQNEGYKIRTTALHYMQHQKKYIYPLSLETKFFIRKKGKRGKGEILKEKEREKEIKCQKKTH